MIQIGLVCACVSNAGLRGCEFHIPWTSRRYTLALTTASKSSSTTRLHALGKLAGLDSLSLSMLIAHVTCVASKVRAGGLSWAFAVLAVVACPPHSKQQRRHVSERGSAKLQGCDRSSMMTASPHMLLALSLRVSLPCRRSLGCRFPESQALWDVQFTALVKEAEAISGPRDELHIEHQLYPQRRSMGFDGSGKLVVPESHQA